LLKIEFAHVGASILQNYDMFVSGIFIVQ